MLRMMGRNLSSQLGTNRTHSGNQYHLSGNILKHLFHIRLNRISPQQVFNLYRLHLTDRKFSRKQLVHPRQVHKLTWGFVTDSENLSLILRFRTWYGNVNLIDVKFIDSLHNTFPAAKNRDIIDVSSPFILVIINKAAYYFIGFLCPFDISKDHLPCTSSTD